MAQYQAEDGREDRHGEMTGAISVNLVLCCPPVTAWCVFIGPWLFADRVWLTVTTGVAMALVLPLALLKPSRSLWAWLSDWAGRVEGDEGGQEGTEG